MQVLEGQFFKLTRKALDPHTPRQGGIDIRRFAGNPLSLLALIDEVQGAHIVQTVGQFHQQDPHILRQSEDEFLQVFGLLGTV